MYLVMEIFAMSAYATWLILYGTIPDDVFTLLMAIPLSFAAVVLGDWAIDSYKWRNK